MWLADEKMANAIFTERMDHCKEQLQMYEDYIKELSADCEGVPDHPDHPSFGDYILLSWGARRMKDDISWCEWVMDLLKKRSK